MTTRSPKNKPRPKQQPSGFFEVLRDFNYSQCGFINVFLQAAFFICFIWACVDTVPTVERIVSGALTVLIAAIMIFRYIRWRKKANRWSKRERKQYELDKIGAAYGSNRTYIDVGLIVWFLILIVPFFCGQAWWVNVICAIMVPVPIWLLIRSYRKTHLKTPCPNCGGRLRVTREIFHFCGTVISCDSCKMKTLAAQAEEDSGFGY